MNMGIGKIQITIIVFLILLMVIPPVSPHTSSTPSHKLNGISLNYSLQTPVKNVNKSNNTPKYIFPLSNSTKLDMERRSSFTEVIKQTIGKQLTIMKMDSDMLC